MAVHIANGSPQLMDNSNHVTTKWAASLSSAYRPSYMFIA